MDIRFINVEHSIKFRTMKEAEREANRLKMVMDRFAKRTKIPFACLFGVSQLSLRFGEYVLFHNGKKGRPIRKAVSKIKLFEPPGNSCTTFTYFYSLYRARKKNFEQNS